MRQIAFPLLPHADGPSRIVVGVANEGAVQALSCPETWPFGTAILSGAPRSGKSLLGRWFAENGRGDVVDDADSLPEDELFHRWNRAQEARMPLLIVSARPPGQGEGAWAVRLPDLASRLGAALHLEIGTPDDAMMGELMLLHAEMRGLALDETATRYLVGRCERSHLAAQRLIEAIDRLSLERKQAPTMAIWRDALEELGAEVRGASERDGD
jgi:hypothetical protein